MLKTHKPLIGGFVDPLSLFAVIFLVATIAVGTAVTNNRNISLSPEKEAMMLIDEGKSNTNKTTTPKATSASSTCNVSLISTSGCGGGGCAATQMAQTWKTVTCGEKVVCTDNANCKGNTTTTTTMGSYCSPEKLTTAVCKYGCIPDTSGGKCKEGTSDVITAPTPTPTPKPTATPVSNPSSTSNSNTSSSTCNVSLISTSGCGGSGCATTQMAQTWKTVNCETKVVCTTTDSCKSNTTTTSSLGSYCSSEKLTTNVCKYGCNPTSTGGTCKTSTEDIKVAPTTAPNTTQPSCVGEGGTVSSGASTCCSGLTKSDCVAQGSFSYCTCRKPSTNTTATTKSCTVRTCSSNKCNVVTSSIPYSQSCAPSNCVSDIDCKYSAGTSTPTPKPSSSPSISPDNTNGWHYTCSLGGDFAMYVKNSDLSIDWANSKRCSSGCINGACTGKIVDMNDCKSGQISLDKFEKCVDGVWQCVPGQIRRISVPGQTKYSWMLNGCDESGQIYPINDTSSIYIDSLSCNGNSLVGKDKKTILNCGSNEICLNKGTYGFVTESGCYNKDYISSNTCSKGEFKEPKEVNECKQVCGNNSNWEIITPPECFRDPKYSELDTICSPNGKYVFKESKIVDTCSGGCAYGRCLPSDNIKACEEGDSYMAGTPACLVKCMDGKYRSTIACLSDITMTGNWSNEERIVILESLYKFWLANPSINQDLLSKIIFERVDQPYLCKSSTECSNNIEGMYSYLNIFGQISGDKIIIPDTGTVESTIDHEIVHAISRNSSEIQKEFIKVTGCHQDPTNPNGNYLFSEQPYRDYGATNCTEGIAVSCGEQYMDSQLSCGMETSQPKTYNFCKDKIFNGRQFCETNNQSSMINKVKNFFARLPITTVHAADIASTVGSIENKLQTIIPGVTDIGKVNKEVGEPSETIQKDDINILVYPSSDLSKSNLVYIKNNIVTFIQIVFDENYIYNVTDITKNYGEPENKSYSTHSQDNIVYSYPSKGISFHINNNSNQVFMIQKYVSMTETQFKESVGKDFTSQSYGDNLQEVKDIKEQLTQQKPTKTSKSSLSSIYNMLIFVAGALFVLVAIFIIIRKIKRNKPKIPSMPINNVPPVLRQ